MIHGFVCFSLKFCYVLLYVLWAILWGESLCWKCFLQEKNRENTDYALTTEMAWGQWHTYNNEPRSGFLTITSHWKELEVFGQRSDYRPETKRIKSEKGTSYLSESKKVFRKRTQESTWRGSLAKMGHSKSRK